MYDHAIIIHFHAHIPDDSIVNNKGISKRLKGDWDKHMYSFFWSNNISFKTSDLYASPYTKRLSFEHETDIENENVKV